MISESNKQKVLALYPEFHNIYGPYLRKDGRKIVILYDGKRRSARQLAKVKLEVKIGRRLLDGEEVDHVDGDFTNDVMRNLQLLSSKANLSKQQLYKYGAKVTCVCAYCGEKFKRSRSKVGNFCSYSHRSLKLGCNQYGNKLIGYKPN